MSAILRFFNNLLDKLPEFDDSDEDEYIFTCSDEFLCSMLERVFIEDAVQQDSQLQQSLLKTSESKAESFLGEGLLKPKIFQIDGLFVGFKAIEGGNPDLLIIRLSNLECDTLENLSNIDTTTFVILATEFKLSIEDSENLMKVMKCFFVTWDMSDSSNMKNCVASLIHQLVIIYEVENNFFI